MGHLSNSMRMFLLWTIFFLFLIPNESKYYLVKTNDSDTDNIEPIDNPDYDNSATTEEAIEITSEDTSTLPTGDGTGVPDIPGSFTTTIGGNSYSNSEHTTMSCSSYSSGVIVQGQICLAPLGGWRTCRFPPDDCNLDWPKLYKDLKMAYEEHKEKMEKLKVKMANMKVNMDRKMKNMNEKMAKMNEKFSDPCFPFC